MNGDEQSMTILYLESDQRKMIKQAIFIQNLQIASQSEARCAKRFEGKCLRKTYQLLNYNLIWNWGQMSSMFW